MNQTLAQALDVLVRDGGALRTQRYFDWPRAAQEVAGRIRLSLRAVEAPPMVAVVGGASSGKSTVFNNLLGGHLTSRITARGHTTLGPILAAHEASRETVDRLVATGVLMPALRAEPLELDGNATGQPDTLQVVFHTVDMLREVLLFDLPDFTSYGAHQEGDVAMSLLPWFDKLLVVVDHERWFDRQSISELRQQSVRFGHTRWVLFNRTREGQLLAEDRDALARQMERLGAEGMTVLEFRRGRGLLRFPPGTFDEVIGHIRTPSPDRSHVLTTYLAEAANRVLNLNEERTARLAQLTGTLDAAVARGVPNTRECMLALMTGSERRQIEPITRILRLGDSRAWVATQTRRLQQALRQVPLVSAVMRPGTFEGSPEAVTDRAGIAEAFFESTARRLAAEIQRLTVGSAFWDEIQRWTGLAPAPRRFVWDEALRADVRALAADFDRALSRWLARVESECQGLSPYLKGAVGFSGVGLAVALVAAPGPVAALTLATAGSAIAGALGHLLTAAGAGALLGKPMGRLVAVIEERLLGSEEHRAVQVAAERVCDRMRVYAHALVEEGRAEAERLVLEPDDPLAEALEAVRAMGEAA